MNKRHVVEGSPTTLSRADQALQTLERYKARLDEVTGTLSALEIEDLVTIRDVTSVLQRLEMVRRISEEIRDYVVELGTDGRLLSLQLEELVGGLGNDRELVIRDYLPATKSELTAEEALANLEALNALFYFCGFTAAAVFVSRLRFCIEAQCGTIQAAVVAAALLFVAWTATTALVAKDIFKGGLRKPAPRRAGPPMAHA